MDEIKGDAEMKRELKVANMPRRTQMMIFEEIGGKKERKLYCWSYTIRNKGVSLPRTEAANVQAPGKICGMLSDTN